MLKIQNQSHMASRSGDEALQLSLDEKENSCLELQVTWDKEEEPEDVDKPLPKLNL